MHHNAHSAATMPAVRSRRMRAAMAVHGGASSLLRLSQPGGLRLPSGPALGDWVQRAAAALRPFDMVAVAEDAPAALVTALQPSTAWRTAPGLR